MSSREETLRRKAEEHGQGHLFRFWGELSPEERERLLDQIEAVPFDTLEHLKALLARPAEEDEAPDFQPPELFPVDRSSEEEARAVQARRRGEELLSEGRVGYLLVAGGQASRLGVDYPKGCYPVGPVSGRSLFEWHARRLLAAQRRHGAPTPWYVMTSPANDADTRAFFAENRHFGLDPQDVRFFAQGMMPALDAEGRILMRSRAELFLAPNGHGGVLAAFRDSGALEDAKRRGLTTLSYFQVDNPLVRPADAEFIGLHALAEADMSSKVVEKRDPAEKVGVIGRADGKLGCIEYSDLPESLREARDDEGKLLFRAGNIAVHAFSLDFLERVTDGRLELPWHVARKTMQVVDEQGNEVEREGFKFETFVFDALGLAERSVTVEVPRSREFSPVKNAEGPDSPETARRDLTGMFRDWLQAAGLAPPPPDADGVHPVEVDPLLAENAEEFRRTTPRGPRKHGDGHLYEANER